MAFTLGAVGILCHGSHLRRAVPHAGFPQSLRACWPRSPGVDSGVMSDVTRLLNALDQGDPHAASQLLPLVYEELRRLAAQKLAREAPGQTLDATALVHEAYLRLIGPDDNRH